MNILYVVERFPSKTEYFILNEILEIEKKGFKVLIVAQRCETDFPEYLVYLKNRTYYASPFFHLLKSLLYVIGVYPSKIFKLVYDEWFRKNQNLGLILSGLKKLIISTGFVYQLRNAKFNHIHAHFAFWPSKIGIYLSCIVNKPLSLSLHAQDIFCNNRKTIQYELGKAQFVFTCTKYNQGYLSSLFPDHSAKIHHIYHGIDIEKWPFRKSNEIPKSKKIHILSIGRLVEKKGFLDLLEAIKILNHNGEKYKCTIIGEGPMRSEIVDYINKNNLNDSVSLLGALNQHLVKNYYYTSDLFVLACVEATNKDKDGLPNVIVEALATGLPVISTRISAIPELISHKVTGILAPECSPSSLSVYINELSEDETLRKKLSLNGRKKIEKDFVLNSSTLKMVNYFKSYNEKS